MVSGMDISVSGLQAASLRFTAAASNIANADSDGAVPSTPPSQRIDPANSSVYQPVAVSQTSSAAVRVVNLPPLTITRTS